MYTRIKLNTYYNNCTFVIKYKLGTLRWRSTQCLHGTFTINSTPVGANYDF